MTRRTHQTRWLVERLESRVLLSADLLPAENVLSIIGTEGNDSALIRTLESDIGDVPKLVVTLNGQSFEYNIAVGQKIHIDLLGGDDRLDARITVDADWEFVLGEGDDHTRLETLIGDRSSESHYEIRDEGGNNETQLIFGDGEEGRVPPTGAHVTAEYRSGAGNDNVVVQWEHSYEFRPGKTAQTDYEFDLGSGNDELTVDLGELDAPGTGFFKSVSGLSTEFSAVDYQAGASVGKDIVLQMDLANLESFVLKTGNRDDDFRIDLNQPQKPVPELSVSTGGGDDSVDVNVAESFTIVTGAGTGSPHVKAFTGATAAETQSFFAYAPSFTGGVRVASGDINGDGVADIITGAGPGAGPHVKVFDGQTNAEIRSFFAYSPSFTGGVFVAAGDVNGDGHDDIITGAGSGSPHVKVFDGRTGAEIRSFFAYAPVFAGGVRVAAGDVNGDGRADIITGAGPGAAPHVKVFDAVSGAEIRSFFAYSPTFTGGVFVAAGDVNGDGVADIVTGADAGGAPHVKVFDGTTLAALQSFFAYTPSFTGGVRVAAGDINGDGRADIITGAGPGAGPQVKVFDGQSATELRSFFPYDPAFRGGVYVAAADVTGGGVFDLTLDTGAADDHVELEFITGAPRVDLIDVHMGTGADNFAMKWAGALQDAAVEQKVVLLLNLGGADPDQPGGGDEVVVSFVGGDPNQPIVIGFLWNSEDVPPSENKSQRIELNSTDGILKLSNQVTGGSGRDNMQLFFQGKLKVGSVTPQVNAMLDLGDGNDQALVDLTSLGVTKSGMEPPIAVDARGAEALVVTGTSGSDRITVNESTVAVSEMAVVVYSGRTLRVNALGGDDIVTMTGINPKTDTTLDGGEGRDKFIGRFDSDQPGNLSLLNFEQIVFQGPGRLIGTLISDVPLMARLSEEEG